MLWPRTSSIGFGGTVNQAVVHQGTHEKILCRGFGKYRNPSSSSPCGDGQHAYAQFRRYHKLSSSSPERQGAVATRRFRKYRKSSSSSPITDKRSAFHSFRRHRKPSRNAERTTKRSTFRLLLKVPEVLSPHATIYGYVK